MTNNEQRITIQPISENIYGLVAPVDEIEVRALLVCGDRFSLLIDTLCRPADLEPARPLIEGRERPLLIVNSHADWDHWWGNAAFPDSPVIAHRLTLDRQRAEGKRSLAARRRQDPQYFAGVELRPATIAFDGELTLDLGGSQVELSLLPGHTPDHIVAFIPKRRILFAADAAEDPIPLVGGPLGQWPDALEAWADRVSTVVPAHGNVGGPELLRRNAQYLRCLSTDPQASRPELSGAVEFYRNAHARNRRKVAGSP
jgi:glyoxylase-like metal-dependent hydrolase (beta-lactamase superfamily II)